MIEKTSESQHIVYLEENKFKGRKKGLQYCIILFYSKDRSMN